MVMDLTCWWYCEQKYKPTHNHKNEITDKDNDQNNII